MRTVAIPPLAFSDWIPWADRGTFSEGERPGVYLLAVAAKSLAGTTPSWTDVSYIGMTNSKGGLTARWKQFDKAVQGLRGHSGGNTAFARLGHYESWQRKLFVSAMPVACDVTARDESNLIRMGWVAFLEYEAFAKYSRAVSKAGKPEFNVR